MSYIKLKSFKCLEIPKIPIFLAPPVSPRDNFDREGVGSFNPSVRLYKYNRTTGAILDYEQYYLNLLETSETADWQLEYRAVETYNLSDLSAESLKTLAGRFREDADLFQKYYLYNSVSHDRSPCTVQSKRRHVCSILEIDFKDFDRCMGGGGHPETTHELVRGLKLGLLGFLVCIGLSVAPIVLLAVCFYRYRRPRRVHGRNYQYAIIPTEGWDGIIR